ncbi:MAG TPA: type II CAAX endopeptidase family protein [Terriglobia bacterium]
MKDDTEIKTTAEPGDSPEMKPSPAWPGASAPTSVEDTGETGTAAPVPAAPETGSGISPTEALAQTGLPASFAGSVAERRTMWRARDLLLFVAFSIVWLMVSFLLSVAVYAALRPVMGWQTPVGRLGDNTFFAVLVQLVLYGPILLYIFLLVVVQYRQPFWDGVGWRWPGRGPAVKLLFCGVLLAIVVAAGSALLPDRRDFPLEKLFSSPSAAYALGGFAVLVAPFMEELIFRGVLFAFCERLAGLRWAVVVTALLFAALHYPDYQGAWTHLGMILVVGVVFSVARAVTGSLAPSFLLHTAYNATFMLALFLGTHHFRNLQAVVQG